MKLYQIIFIFLLFIGVNNKALANYSIYSRSEIAIIKSAIKYIDKGQIEVAKQEIQKLRDPVITQAIDWLIFIGSKEVNFQKAVDNYNKFKHWPRAEELKRAVENSINKNVDKNLALKWFSVHKPSGEKASMYYLNIILKNCNTKNCKIGEIVKKTWLDVNFSQEVQDDFLKNYGRYLNSSDYQKKIEKLLWQKKYDRAQNLIKYVSADYQKLYIARISLMLGKGNINKIINQVPSKLKNNIGLLHDTLVAYEKSKDDDNLYKLINKIKASEAHQEAWWPFKSRHIRALIEKQQYNLAYSLTSNHKIQNHQYLAESEWLAGWISLRYLHKPLLARTHFKKMFNVSKMPISIAKSTYWIARTYEAEGNTEHANIWYEKASQRITTFYGQLAAQKIAKTTHFNSRSKIKVTAQDFKNFRNNQYARLAIFFMHYQEGYLAKDFIIKAFHASKTSGERYLVVASGLKYNRMDLSVIAAKEAAVHKLIVPEYLYPLKKISNNSEIPSAFIYGLIRQESLFHVSAQSPVGALGLMQVMPKTGESIAKLLGIRFNVKKLHLDSEYNTKFGIHYLTTLAKTFDGSYILSAAAYNAGPKNALKWINRFGDPRNMKKVEDVVDWMESITFPETRNYVQRILEAMQIYRHILNSKSDILTINTARDICYTNS